MSRNTRYLALVIFIHRHCHGLLIIAIDNHCQMKEQMPKLKLANAAITDMQMRQRDVAALDAKTTKS